MAAYLRFYQLEKSPFENQKQKGLVLGTHSLRAAFAEIKRGLEEDSPRICFSGSSGVGKTSLARALPKRLGDSTKLAAIGNPRRSWQEIRASIAKKFNLSDGAISRRSLMSARARDDQSLVLLIDQAELLSHESLDHPYQRPEQDFSSPPPGHRGFVSCRPASSIGSLGHRRARATALCQQAC